MARTKPVRTGGKPNSTERKANKDISVPNLKDTFIDRLMSRMSVDEKDRAA